MYRQSSLALAVSLVWPLFAVAQTTPPPPVTPLPVPAQPGQAAEVSAALLPGRASVVESVSPLPASAGEPTADYPSRVLYDHNLQTIHWGTALAYRPVAGPEILDPLLPADPFAGWRWPNSILEYATANGTTFRMEGLARGLYYNDQRIEWTGVESSFAGEAILRPSVRADTGNGWVVSSEAEFFINQPYNSTILRNADTEQYLGNFKSDPFQIFQLYVQAEYGDFAVRFGRSRTPFGRYQSPMFTNRLSDAPFIRTDIVGFTETGIFARYRPAGGLVIDLAGVNGEPDLDTNSSKGVVGRIGWEGTYWTAGLSGKVHDGISSEEQKRYNNAVGIDGSTRLGRVLLYGEAVYDEHGFRRDFENLVDTPLPGPRSIYGRDVYPGVNTRPIRGLSYHVGAAYRADRWTLDANFGSYFPERIGIRGHDEEVHRGVLKGVYSFTPNLQGFIVGIFESERPVIGVPRTPISNPWAIFTGIQMGF